MKFRSFPRLDRSFEVIGRKLIINSFFGFWITKQVDLDTANISSEIYALGLGSVSVAIPGGRTYDCLWVVGAGELHEALEKAKSNNNVSNKKFHETLNSDKSEKNTSDFEEISENRNTFEVTRKNEVIYRKIEKADDMDCQQRFAEDSYKNLGEMKNIEINPDELVQDHWSIFSICYCEHVFRAERLVPIKKFYLEAALEDARVYMKNPERRGISLEDTTVNNVKKVIATTTSNRSDSRKEGEGITFEDVDIVYKQDGTYIASFGSDGEFHYVYGCPAMMECNVERFSEEKAILSINVRIALFHRPFDKVLAIFFSRSLRNGNNYEPRMFGNIDDLAEKIVSRALLEKKKIE